MERQSAALAKATRLYEECLAAGCGDDELVRRMVAAYGFPEEFVRKTPLPMRARFAELLTQVSGGVTYGSEEIVGPAEFVRRAFALGRLELIPYIVGRGYADFAALAFQFAARGDVEAGAAYARGPADFAALIYGALLSGDAAAYNAALEAAPPEADAALRDQELAVYALGGRNLALIDAVLADVAPAALDFGPLLAAALGAVPEFGEDARDAAEELLERVLYIVAEGVAFFYLQGAAGAVVGGLFRGAAAAARFTAGYGIDRVLAFAAAGPLSALVGSTLVFPAVYEAARRAFDAATDWAAAFVQRRFEPVFDYLFGKRGAAESAARRALFSRVWALAPPGARVDWGPVALAAVGTGDAEAVAAVGRAMPPAARGALDATDALTLALARDDALFAAAARAFPGPRSFGALLRAAAYLRSTAKFARVLALGAAEDPPALAAALDAVELAPEFEARLRAENILAA